MARRQTTHEVIRLEGVRQNNLKDFSIDIPKNKLVVITGLSGSGKSSLAFDTLYAEGQRRYIETFSPYARQFFDRMDKPAVDRIIGIPPAIAIEQRNSVKTTRSTVGTMTEICDHMKVLWPWLSDLFCRGCQALVRKENPERIWSELKSQLGRGGSTEVLVAFDLTLSERLGWEDSVGLLQQQGYQRLLVEGEIVRLDELTAFNPVGLDSITIVQDRIKDVVSRRSRLMEAVSQAYHFGKGFCSLYLSTGAGSGWVLLRRFSEGFHCAKCDLDYREPRPSHFSFNNPLGACSTCKGFGRIITIDYELAVPNRSLTLKEGAVKPWQTGQGRECQNDMERLAPKYGVPLDVSFNLLTPKQKSWVIEGDPHYGSCAEKEWPRAWYGVRGYFKWLESKSYKMHVRVLLSRYRAYTECPDCKGLRLRPDSLLFKAGLGDGFINLSQFYTLSVDQALEWIQSRLKTAKAGPRDPVSISLKEVESRLFYLKEVGLGYLTLDRPSRTLSGGETERVNLTTCLGSRLVNTLFVLDEPSVGLHPRDTKRLVGILQKLRDCGNTVVVVEHEAMVMEAADEIIDLGPGHGNEGGRVVFQGDLAKMLKSSASLTGRYLSGQCSTPPSRNRPVDFEGASSKKDWVLRESVESIPSTLSMLRLKGANLHNLRNLDVCIPLNRITCLSGVSGSGKTTLMKGILYPLLGSLLRTRGKGAKRRESDEDTLEPEMDPDISNKSKPVAELIGWEVLDEVVLVDQGLLGRTPRSNPGLYVGAFDGIRQLFAESPEAKNKRMKALNFSFNSRFGQCVHCRGAGFEKIEMQFLSDVYIRCPICDGKRYQSHILEATISPNSNKAQKKNIAEILEMTVVEVMDYLRLFNSKHALKSVRCLEPLVDVGLGYLKLGQPLNTMSGGESQRIKLASYLAGCEDRVRSGRSTLFLFDEPTTGLHFADIELLLNVFQKLVDAGQSLLVIEHNPDVLKAADWIIDLGPEAGDHGGRLVAEGPPEKIALSSGSHTGQALQSVLSLKKHRTGWQRESFHSD